MLISFYLSNAAKVKDYRVNLNLVQFFRKFLVRYLAISVITLWHLVSKLSISYWHSTFWGWNFGTLCLNQLAIIFLGLIGEISPISSHVLSNQPTTGGWFSSSMIWVMFLVTNYTLNNLAFPYWRQISLWIFHFSFTGTAGGSCQQFCWRQKNSVDRDGSDDVTNRGVYDEVLF